MISLLLLVSVTPIRQSAVTQTSPLVETTVVMPEARYRRASLKVSDLYDVAISKSHRTLYTLAYTPKGLCAASWRCRDGRKLCEWRVDPIYSVISRLFFDRGELSTVVRDHKLNLPCEVQFIRNGNVPVTHLAVNALSSGVFDRELDASRSEDVTSLFVKFDWKPCPSGESTGFAAKVSDVLRPNSAFYSVDFVSTCGRPTRAIAFDNSLNGHLHLAWKAETWRTYKLGTFFKTPLLEPGPSSCYATAIDQEHAYFGIVPWGKYGHPMTLVAKYGGQYPPKLIWLRPGRLCRNVDYFRPVLRD